MSGRPHHGVLLINLGTPDAPETSAIRRYLKQFLSDPFVIDLPKPLRWLLLNGVILPFRPFKTQHAYASIWTEHGSPLLTISQKLQQELQLALGSDYKVVLGMRYGSPSIEQALNSVLQSCEHVVVLPLYPQYAAASAGTSIAKVMSHLSRQWTIPRLTIFNQFSSLPSYIGALAHSIQHHPSYSDTEALILSYHGLPIRHLRKSRCTILCTDQPCPFIQENNHYCYRAQCYATSRAIAAQLNVPTDFYHVTFQSRLGRTPWIKPYTDEVLPKLAKQGLKKIMVACPSFTVDCLETLEEIGIQAKENWQALGGESLYLVPCLNTQSSWIQGLRDLIIKAC